MRPAAPRHDRRQRTSWRDLVSTDLDQMGTSYRPAIDGYRGLFIILVMLYHFGVTELAGGWVGINHFFTFSGFLIGGILIKEWQRRGRIDAVRFYLRRARRIVPAMVLLVTAVLAHTLLVDSGDRPQTAGDAFATITFWQNWRLVSRDDQYFDLLVEPSPLRHVWTLGVEEQFYLLAPFVVAAVLLVRRRWARTVIALGLAVASAVWTAHLAGAGATGSRLYYGTDVRAQAILVGLAVAMLMTPDRRGRAPRLSRSVAEVIGWGGTLLSISAFFLLDETGRWIFERGGMVIFAVMAACMSASALDPRPLRINRLMGWSPLVHLGQISYGLYLFHWPITIWLPMDGLPMALAIVIKLVLAWICAVLSYRFVELPVMIGGFRALVPRSLGRGLRQWAAPTVIAALAAVSLALSTVWSPLINGDWDGTPLSATAEYRPPAGDLKVAVVGSSIAQSMRDGFRGREYPGLDVSGHTRRGSCNPVPITFRYMGGGEVEEDPTCASWRSQWPGEVRGSGAQIVLSPIETALTQPMVIDGRTFEPGAPEHDRQVRRALDALLAQTEDAGARQLQIVNATCHDDPATVRDGAELGAVKIDPTSTNQVVSRWAKGVQDEGGPVSVAVLDLNGVLCANGYRANINGAEVYVDRVHFARQGAQLVWTWLAPEIVTAWNFRDA
ncbi:acyltransferase family protein [Janibacter limosus]|uniref:Acyltransferase n=1 Tax=Janibacter limosus TaxID=53458 RepID=A0A4P6MZ95_9MICO|nr:acyltransferase family protein [Janibacter limosus]QBF47083.1 acyltransferase [Janibacter limosus]